MKSKVLRAFPIITGLLILGLIFISNPSTHTKAAPVKPNNMSMTSSNLINPDFKVLVKDGAYRYYPETATYTNTQGAVVTKNLRSKCSNGTLREQPWVAYYSPTGNPSLAQSNNFASDINSSCPDRYRNGGRGVWMPLEVYGGWGLPTSNGASFAGNTGWITPAYIPYGAALWSDQFNDSSVPGEDDPVRIWKTTATTVYDNEPMIHGNDGNTDLSLLSQGTAYFRIEFNLTQDNIDWINANPANSVMNYWSRADDFHIAYINGIELGRKESIDPPPNQAGTINRPISPSQLRVGQNVIAVQVADKATWHKEGFASNSNDVGYTFKLNFSFTDAPVTPAISCTVSPQTGLAPLVVRADITPNSAYAGRTVTYDYDMNWDGNAFSPEYTGRTTPVYYTFQSPGSYRVRVKAATAGSPAIADQYATCAPDPIPVSPPTSGGGGEVAP
jgi:hypothetical protein